MGALEMSGYRGYGFRRCHGWLMNGHDYAGGRCAVVEERLGASHAENVEIVVYRWCPESFSDREAQAEQMRSLKGKCRYPESHFGMILDGRQNGEWNWLARAPYDEQWSLTQAPDCDPRLIAPKVAQALTILSVSQ